MKKHLRYGLVILALVTAASLTHQVYCRIVPPSNRHVAKWAYKYSAQGRGYNSFQEFLKSGVQVEDAGYAFFVGRREFNVYYRNKDSARENRYGKTELVRLEMTVCGRPLDTLTMSMGDFLIRANVK